MSNCRVTLAKPSGVRCPKCGVNTNAEFIGLGEVSSTRYRGAIPEVAGIEKESRKVMAYWKCNNCVVVFYTKPEKA